ALPDFNMKALCDKTSECVGDDMRLVKHALSNYGLSEENDGMVACETAALVGEALEPLAEEIGMSFAYVSHLYPQAELGQLLLTGGGANIAGLGDSLSNLLELETHVVTPLSLLRGTSYGDASDDPSLTMAMGAALCGEVAV
ncbi:MAG: hypothetical protein AB8C95_06845, partial [Phycisphaeraceae bacterium]